MVRENPLFKILLMLPLWAGAAWAGTDERQHFIGKYYVTWNGINLAAAELSIDQDRDAYSMRLAARSAGLVNLFTRHRSDTVAHGRRSGDSYHPELYETHYWTKKKPRHIKIAFDASGRVTDEIVEPPEDRTERAEVPHRLKDGALDPLTLVLALAAGNHAPRVFDAKHLYDGKAVPGDEVMLRTYNGRRAAVPLDLTRVPVAGMTEKEMKEYRQGEPVLRFYLSSGKQGVPLYMTMPVALGTLKGTLVQECGTWDECRIE